MIRNLYSHVDDNLQRYVSVIISVVHIIGMFLPFLYDVSQLRKPGRVEWYLIRVSPHYYSHVYLTGLILSSYVLNFFEDEYRRR